MLHYFIVIPYYFFGALFLLSAMVLLCRITRIKVAIHYLVGVAITVSAIGLALTLGSYHVSIDDFRSIPMLILGGLSFVFALIDAALVRALPLPLDEEIDAL